MMPYVAYAQLESLQVVRNAVATFDEKCVRMIKAHPDKLPSIQSARWDAPRSTTRERGFLGAAELAQQAIETGKPVEEVAEE